MRILIAEDQRDLNQLLKKRLKEAGYSVDACFDGAAVFDYLLGAEYDALVLDIMMQNAGIVLSREKLEQHVWDYGYSGGSNVIDVYIRYLRKKLDQGHPVKYIHTVRGAGYVLKEGEG